MSGTPRKFAFIQRDVFTSRALEGNSLAVFLDARGLTDAEMQALAREMNLSETTFILPRDAAIEAREGVRVRIFTVQEELPFAGHPTLGTAAVLRQEGFTFQGFTFPKANLDLARDDSSQGAGGSASTPADASQNADEGVRATRAEQEQNADEGARAARKSEVVLDLNVGKIPVTFSPGENGQVFGEMRQRDPQFGSVHSREDIARATGLAVDDFDAELPIQTVSTGLPFAMVPLRRAETLRNLNINFAQAAEYLEHSDTKFLYFVTRDVSGSTGEDARARLHARMIFYNGEDPATGSAAGCCAAWMVQHGVAKSDEQALIAQGLQVHRPSYIHVRATRSGEKVTNVRVGGYSVEVLRGEVTL